MANICNFEMILKGDLENRNAFLDAMEQKGKYCMGRGAYITDRNTWNEETQVVADCKWSVFTALYTDAHSMQTQKDTGEGYWYNDDGFIDDHIFIDFVEATFIFKLKIEIVSWEGGCEFSEHYVIENGVIQEWEECTYTETYDEETEEWTEQGGFPHLF